MRTSLRLWGTLRGQGVSFTHGETQRRSQSGGGRWPGDKESNFVPGAPVLTVGTSSIHEGRWDSGASNDQLGHSGPGPAARAVGGSRPPSLLTANERDAAVWLDLGAALIFLSSPR